MQLAVWTYEGPPHVGAMRIAASMKGVHYVLHAPQGDTYADLLFTMIERRDTRPPVTSPGMTNWPRPIGISGFSGARGPKVGTSTACPIRLPCHRRTRITTSAR